MLTSKTTKAKRFLVCHSGHLRLVKCFFGNVFSSQASPLSKEEQIVLWKSQLKTEKHQGQSRPRKVDLRSH